ncbi:MAG: hypothetical protein ACK6CT_02380 [Planctomycetia bacterium]
MFPRRTTSTVLLALLVTAVACPQRPVRSDDLMLRVTRMESLTPELARRIVTEYPNPRFAEKRRQNPAVQAHLMLNGLTTLDPATAAVLAEYDRGPIQLTSLPAIDVETAKALVAFKEPALLLPGLTSLSPEVARLLVDLPAWQCTLPNLTQIWWLPPLSLETERGLNRDPHRNLREPVGGRPLPGVV